MTTDRDTARIVRSWLREDGHESADRLLELVFDSLATTPQRRSVRPARRFQSMSTTAKVAIAAGVAVAVAFAGLTLIPRSNGTVGGPSPSPSPALPSASAPAPSASSVAVALPIPEAFWHHWYAMPVQVGRIGEAAPLRMGLRDSIFPGDANFSVDWTGPTSASLQSVVSDVGDSTWSFQATPIGRDCDLRDSGTYRVSLSPGATKLTLTLVNDACAARVQILPGTWAGSTCSIQARGIADDDCLGELEAGAHMTNYFIPRLPAGMPSWDGNPGAITYTVPDGWANEEDWPVRYVLTPAASYARGRTFDQGGIDAVSLWARHAPATFDASCQAVPKPGTGGSIRGVESAFRDDPALSIGSPHAFSIDGHQAEWLDVAIAQGYRAPCHRADGIVAPLIASTGADPYGFTGLGGTQPDRARVVLIDLGGETMYVVIESAQPAERETFADLALPIVESFRFGP